MDNINFTGGFLVKKTGVIGWRKIIKQILPNSAYLKGNFLGKGNMFISVNNKYDKEIATYLLSRNFVFSYYPNIDQKSGICSRPKDLAEALVSSSKVITDKKQIMAHVKEVERASIPIGYIRKPNDHMEQTLNVLRQADNIPPVEKLSSQTKNKVTIFTDRNGNVVAKASPNNARGKNFILIFPRYDENLMEMVKTDFQGNICYWTNDIKKLDSFKRDFRAALLTSK